MNNYTVDLIKKTTPFPHYWERCVGSCHAVMALREDWRAHLKKCRKELGFEYVRFHGIFSDEMSVYVRNRKSGKYSFFNVDSIFDFLLSIGMKPFVELGFMPKDLASGTRTIFHYNSNVTPPKDYGEWAELVKAFTGHLVSRYGIKEVRSWFFEVWNEPDLEGFWSGTREEYFKLYKYSAEAIKRIDPKIPVGGPASSRNRWIPDMIEFCSDNRLPLDFVSTHHYPSDVALGWDMDMEERLARTERDTLKKMTARARSEAGSLPLYYTEWNTSSSCGDHYHDEPYASAHVMKALADNQGLVDIYSFWTFTDIFEELSLVSVPFHGGFGLLNNGGIPKPWYRAFQLMRAMGTERIQVAPGSASTCDVFAVRGKGRLVIACVNFNVPRAPIKEEEVSITVRGLKKTVKARIERIDGDNANPKKRWVELGSPEYPDKKTLKELFKASELRARKIIFKRTTEGLVFDLQVPPYGVAVITLY